MRSTEMGTAEVRSTESGAAEVRATMSAMRIVRPAMFTKPWTTQSMMSHVAAVFSAAWSTESSNIATSMRATRASMTAE